MENLEWFSVPYNGLETNIEVTKCGRVRRVKVDWMQRNRVIGEIDFSKLKLHPQGYKILRIQINGIEAKTCFVQQLIAAAFLGYKFQGHKLVVDHDDTNPLNNNLTNLRLLTNRENTSKERSLKSGLPTGVYWHKKNKKYRCQIHINKKRYHIGYYNNVEDASNAYKNKLKTFLYE